MKISDIKIRTIRKEGKMKSVVSVTFDDCFVVHDIKVIEGKSGLFIAMPSRKVGEDRFRDIAHPINREMRELLESEIIKKYQEAVELEQKMLEIEKVENLIG